MPLNKLHYIFKTFVQWLISQKWRFFEYKRELWNIKSEHELRISQFVHFEALLFHLLHLSVFSCFIRLVNDVSLK